MKPVGIWTNMQEDSNGLFMEGKLALNNTCARNAYALMKLTPRPALSGLSIGYRAQRFAIHAKGAKANVARRTLQRVKLIEVSLVSDPSNTRARVSSVKSTPKSEAAADAFILALQKLLTQVKR